MCVRETVTRSKTTPFESEGLSKAFAVLKVHTQLYIYLKMKDFRNERLLKGLAVSKVIDIRRSYIFVSVVLSIVDVVSKVILL